MHELHWLKWDWICACCHFVKLKKEVMGLRFSAKTKPLISQVTCYFQATPNEAHFWDLQIMNPPKSVKSSEPQWANLPHKLMTLHYNIIMALDTEHSTKMYDVTAWRAIQLLQWPCMHADGNGTGSSLRSWNYITTLVNILWDIT